MNIELTELEIPVATEHMQGSLLSPTAAFPGILFVHGWGGSRSHDLTRAREASGLGCVCLTVDLRGHDLDSERSHTINRQENLDDLIAAYDWLSALPYVDASAIAVVGTSYGGYLATLLTTIRKVRWLALRAPALYKDEGWEKSKRQLHKESDLLAYRLSRIDAKDNRALQAGSVFNGDVLIVESEHDDIVPHTVIENYSTAFSETRSLTTRVISGSDHALSTESARRSYTTLLISWLTEMIVGARDSAAKSGLEAKGEIGPHVAAERSSMQAIS